MFARPKTTGSGLGSVVSIKNLDKALAGRSLNMALRTLIEG